MQSIEKSIEQAIKVKARGMLLFPDDFRLFGSPEAIRKALQRLEEKQLIKRVAQGV